MIDDPRVERRHGGRAVDAHGVFERARGAAIHAGDSCAIRLDVTAKDATPLRSLESDAAVVGESVRLSGLIGDGPDDVIAACEHVRMIDEEPAGALRARDGDFDASLLRAVAGEVARVMAERWRRAASQRRGERNRQDSRVGRANAVLAQWRVGASFAARHRRSFM